MAYFRLVQTDTILRLLITGWVVLIAAIVLNIAVQGLRIMGWYEFLTALSKDGSGVFGRMRWIDYAWLFLMYPLLLGLSACGGSWLAERISG